MNRIVRIASMIILAGSAARADAIRPWSGANASARFADQEDSRSGDRARASVQGEQVVRYQGSRHSDPNQLFSATTRGNAEAEASGRAGDLLRVSAGFTAPNPGTLQQGSIPLRPIEASAGWDGDRVIIGSGPGVAPPDSVRLDFAYDASGYVPISGQATLSANGRSSAVVFSNGATYRVGGDLFDDPPGENSWLAGFRHGTFHVDLPVDASGVSDPFRLGLDARLDAWLSSNYEYGSSFSGLRVSLTGVTLADGSSLELRGYTASFQSGLLAPGARPSPVPEPSSLAVAVLVVAAGPCLRRRPAGSSSRRGGPPIVEIAPPAARH